MFNAQTRREFLKTCGLGLIAYSLTGCRIGSAKVSESENAAKPNIIFIMTDDQGYGDTTVYNPESKIPTPNMERLAKHGIVFTDAHSPSAVCTPTRYGLLTGRYCWRSPLKRGVYGGYNKPLIEEERMTVASLMKKYGYTTACIGKWHLGMDWTLKEDATRQRERTIDFTKPLKSGPNELGFDYFFGTPGCPTDDPPFCFVENNKTVGVPDMISPDDPADEGRKLLMVPGWRHEDVDITLKDKAVEFIEENKDKSFFLYLPLSVPHIPWLPPDSVKGKSQAGPRGDQVFLADQILGEIMDKIDELGISDNTLLIFTSDNGPREGVNSHKSSGKLRGQKGEIWEGGHRVPFIAQWPGKIEAASKSDETICLVDLMATCAAILGDELPANAGQDSFNILPALLGQDYNKPIREATVHHSGAGVFAIRQGDWKYILGTKGAGYHEGPESDDIGQLYNLAEDPYETNDLWDDRQDIVKRLKTLLEKYQQQDHSRPI
jgi:arylsulfatase A-like enzyme